MMSQTFDSGNMTPKYNRSASLAAIFEDISKVDSRRSSMNMSPIVQLEDFLPDMRRMSICDDLQLDSLLDDSKQLNETKVEYHNMHQYQGQQQQHQQSPLQQQRPYGKRSSINILAEPSLLEGNDCFQALTSLADNLSPSQFSPALEPQNFEGLDYFSEAFESGGVSSMPNSPLRSPSSPFKMDGIATPSSMSSSSLRRFSFQFPNNLQPQSQAITSPIMNGVPTQGNITSPPPRLIVNMGSNVPTSPGMPLYDSLNLDLSQNQGAFGTVSSTSSLHQILEKQEEEEDTEDQHKPVGKSKKKTTPKMDLSGLPKNAEAYKQNDTWCNFLTDLPTVELNAFLRNSEFSKDDITDLKKVRRQRKNKVYTKRSRIRKAIREGCPPSEICEADLQILGSTL